MPLSKAATVPSQGAFANPFEQLKKAAAVQVTLWWVRTKNGDPEYHFVYGQVLASRRAPFKDWTKVKLAERSYPTPGDRSARRTLYESRCTLLATDACKFLILLQSGAAFQDACTAIELPPPFESAQAFPETLQPLETIFCSPINSRFGLPRHLRGRASMLNETGGLLSRWVPAERTSILSLVAENSRTDFGGWLAAQVGKACDVDLSGSAGDAFGCLELLTFPALDALGRHLVQVDLTKDKGATATLQLAAAAPAGVYTAQVRAMTLQDIYFDELVQLPADGSEVTLPLPPHCDGVIIRVWHGTGGATSQLWHEDERHFIREVSISGSMLGLKASVGAEWLDEAKRSKKHPKIADRARALSEVNQVGMDMPIEINHRDDWEKDLKGAREFFSTTNEPQSDGRFFLKGWGEEHEKLAFAEWLTERLSAKHQRVILLDPYFDTPGLDLVSRANGQVSLLQVVTSTRLDSEDDENGGNGREARLDSALKQLFPVAVGLNLQVLDLRKKAGGKSRIFHDRYVLFLDKDDKPTKGFNLSTSLQSATRTTPLLVTAIPSDVLVQVSEYVLQLLSPSESDSHEVVRIFPVESPRRKARREGLPPEGRLGLLRLLEVIGTPVGADDADGELRIRGIVVGEGIESKVRLSLSPSQLATVRRQLADETMSSAGQLWDGVIQASLAGLQERLPRAVEVLFSDDATGMGRFLRGYLEAHASGALAHEGAYEHKRTISHYFELDFEKALREGDTLNTHHHELPIGTTWPIHLAASALLRLAPRDLDPCIETLRTIDKEGALLSVLVSTLATASQRVQFGEENFCLNLSNTFGRALGVVALWKLVLEKKEPFSVAISQIAPWERSERLTCLGYFIRSHRSARARRDSIAEPKLIDEITGALRRELKKTSLEEMVSLVRTCSWSEGGDAQANNNEILCPLTEARAFPSETAFLIWSAILEERSQREFSRLVDSELIQVWGGTFWYATSEIQDGMLEQVSAELGRLREPLRSPLLYERRFKTWQSISERLMRQLVYLWAIEKARPQDMTQNEEVARLKQQAENLIIEELILERSFGELFELTRVAMGKAPPAGK